MKIEMTEKAYIIARDLASTEIALEAVRKICQPNSAAYIPKKDFDTVTRILSNWATGMYHIIETEEND